MQNIEEIVRALLTDGDFNLGPYKIKTGEKWRDKVTRALEKRNISMQIEAAPLEDGVHLFAVTDTDSRFYG